jgi:cytoskeletal protein CcmA (bactofilin family)
MSAPAVFDPAAAPALVAAGARFRGLVAFRGRARVEGRVEGDIIAWGRVEIGPDAHVYGDVEADEAVVAGEVRGGIRARRRIELRAGARVEGDLRAPRLALADGALLHGRVWTQAGA